MSGPPGRTDTANLYVANGEVRHAIDSEVKSDSLIQVISLHSSSSSSSCKTAMIKALSKLLNSAQKQAFSSVVVSYHAILGLGKSNRLGYMSPYEQPAKVGLRDSGVTLVRVWSERIVGTVSACAVEHGEVTPLELIEEVVVAGIVVSVDDVLVIDVDVLVFDVDDVLSVDDEDVIVDDVGDDGDDVIILSSDVGGGRVVKLGS